MAELKTMEKRQVVKEHTYELAEHVKKEMNALVERAFLTGAFDIDFAYENGYQIPRAIIIAALRTLADDYAIASETGIVDEAENIFQML